MIRFSLTLVINAYWRKKFLSLLFIVSALGLQGQTIPPTCDTVAVITYKIKGRTATGQMTYKIDKPFVAVSRDLLKKYPLRSKIALYDCKWAGTYTVLDIMGKRHRKTIDIFYKGRKKSKATCLCRPAN